MTTNDPVEVRAFVRLENGTLLSAANAHMIVARCTQPTDRMGNRLPSLEERFRNDPPYYQKWVIRQEHKGYIFREVSHGGGICGHHKTVRQLVIATLCGLSSNIRVTIEPVPALANAA